MGGAERERVVLASANPKKVSELLEILGDRFDVVARPAWVPDVVEDADSFEGNARLKAVALVQATGLAALADDSGLVVDALDGAPGIRSARYAGEDATDEQNVVALLDALGDVEDRSARFVCVIVLLRPDGSELVAEGSIAGSIALEPRGSNGFGYDPVFVPDGTGTTFAEMDQVSKHTISHRGRALASLHASMATA